MTFEKWCEQKIKEESGTDTARVSLYEAALDVFRVFQEKNPTPTDVAEAAREFMGRPERIGVQRAHAQGRYEGFLAGANYKQTDYETRLSEVLKERDEAIKKKGEVLAGAAAAIKRLHTSVDEKLRSIMAGNYSFLVSSYRSQISSVFEEDRFYRSVDPDKEIEAIQTNERSFWASKFEHWVECAGGETTHQYIKALGFGDCARAMRENDRRAPHSTDPDVSVHRTPDRHRTSQ